MIANKEEALELCKKYDVKLASYKTVIVTGDGNIYVNTTNVDKTDSSVLFYVKGGKEEQPVKVAEEQSEKVVKEEKTKPKTKVKDGNESNDNI